MRMEGNTAIFANGFTKKTQKTPSSEIEKAKKYRSDYLAQKRKEEKMKQSKSYPNIDMIQTGLQLKLYMDRAGMSVKDIQEYLYLSCPQPIYRWIQGKILPSVDHLLMLSELFEVHMEELLVKKQRILQTEFFVFNDMEFQKRITAYYKVLANSVA